MTLFWKLFLGNAATLLVAVAALAIFPGTLGNPSSPAEVFITISGMVALFLINARIICAALAPLNTLRDALDSLDVPRADAQVRSGRTDEVGALVDAYNTMVMRLHTERDRTVRASLHAQEKERSRVSRELHDEVGQGLTVLLLRLSALRERVRSDIRPQVDELSETTREILQEVRDLSAALSPAMLADLGLAGALQALAAEIRQHAGIAVSTRVELTEPVGDEVALVVYRIAQEALTNVVRHSGARTVRVELVSGQDGLTLSVQDDGHGGEVVPGTGLMGMRERARLVLGDLQVVSSPEHGTGVMLKVPRGLEAAERVDR